MLTAYAIKAAATAVDEFNSLPEDDGLTASVSTLENMLLLRVDHSEHSIAELISELELCVSPLPVGELIETRLDVMTIRLERGRKDGAVM